MGTIFKDANFYEQIFNEVLFFIGENEHVVLSKKSRVDYHFKNQNFYSSFSLLGYAVNFSRWSVSGSFFVCAYFFCMFFFFHKELKCHWDQFECCSIQAMLKYRVHDFWLWWSLHQYMFNIFPFSFYFLFQFFVGIASKLFPEFKFQWLVDQIRANLPLELDFINEGKNCEKMGRLLQNFKYLKVVLWSWVLTFLFSWS